MLKYITYSIGVYVKLTFDQTNKPRW